MEYSVQFVFSILIPMKGVISATAPLPPYCAVQATTLRLGKDKEEARQIRVSAIDEF
jgi:hypothetical protein